MVGKLLAILFASTLLVHSAFSQKENKRWDNLLLGIDLKQGMVVKHDKYMGHLSKGITRGFEADLLKKTTGETQWQRLVHYPNVGLSLIFFNYPTDILGETLALNYVSDYYLIRSGKFESTCRLGIGLAYQSNPYNKEYNNKNITYGSHVTFSLQTKLNIQYNVYRDFYLHGGLSFCHFSMADIKRPNKGLNVFTTDVGLIMLLNRQTEYVPISAEDREFNRKWRYNINFNAFVATYKSSDHKSYPVYTLSLYTQKPLSNLFDLLMGVDFFNNHVLKEVMKDDTSLDHTQPLPDHKKVGVSAGIEYHLNKLSIAFDVGYYIYKPYDFYSILYQRYNIRYYFTDNWFVNGGFKTHGADAENSELGIGYRF